MVPWISKWGRVGFGMMGEQGAESIHAEFNLIEQQHKNQCHNRVERLRRVMVEHFVKNAPSTTAITPPTKKKKPGPE